jgi:hypothetical protein
VFNENISMGRYARWTTTLYHIDRVATGPPPPVQQEDEDEEQFAHRYQAWVATVLPLYRKNRGIGNDPDNEDDHQLARNIQDRFDRVNLGLEPKDAVSLFFVSMVRGERFDQRDRVRRHLPVSENELNFVGEGQDAEQIRATVNKIRRMQYVNHRDRKVLDFGHFATAPVGQGNANMNARAQAEARQLFHNDLGPNPEERARWRERQYEFLNFPPQPGHERVLRDEAREEREREDAENEFALGPAFGLRPRVVHEELEEPRPRQRRRRNNP